MDLETVRDRAGETRGSRKIILRIKTQTHFGRTYLIRVRILSPPTVSPPEQDHENGDNRGQNLEEDAGTHRPPREPPEHPKVRETNVKVTRPRLLKPTIPRLRAEWLSCTIVF